jgi:hypothetical protein
MTRPVAEFYRWIEEARLPEPADRSALGILPTRATRYCDAITAASAYGWWVFPPMDLHLLWDGCDIYWRYPGSGDWLLLQDSVQFPGMMARFDAAAPESVRGCAPPFLTVQPEPGYLQIWTGFVVRTREDWSLLVRAPANLPAPSGVAMFEGIVETDRFFWPVFTNVRFTRSHTPVFLRADHPLIQVQPVPRIAYDDSTIKAITIAGSLGAMSLDDWENYRTDIVVPNTDPDLPKGAYAIAARKRRRSGCPFATSR